MHQDQYEGEKATMELEKIREFATFAQTLKFTDAAQALHMSQSSLSKHIRDLEEELGMLLVERGAAGTGKNALTPAGRRYLELAGAWLDEHDAIVAECRLIADELPRHASTTYTAAST